MRLQPDKVYTYYEKYFSVKHVTFYIRVLYGGRISNLKSGVMYKCSFYFCYKTKTSYQKNEISVLRITDLTEEFKGTLQRLGWILSIPELYYQRIC